MVAGGDIIYARDVNRSVARPLGRLVAQTTQVLTDNAQTALLFGAGSEEIDTHNFHSETTNTGRFTPTSDWPGYYRARIVCFFATQATPVVSGVWVRKNGIAVPPAGRYPGATQAFSLTATVEVALNGTGDYCDSIALQDSAANDDTNVSSQFTSVFSWEYLRPL